MIDADNGLRTRSEILEVFGEPNDEGSDDEWNYASHADDDDETFFTLHWSAENPDTLIGWKMP